MSSASRARLVAGAVVLLLLAAGLVALARRGGGSSPTGWQPERTSYAQSREMSVDGGAGCVRVTLSGTLTYQRSTASQRADRHYRSPALVDPTMTAAARGTCSIGASPLPTDGATLRQTWSTASGTPMGARSRSYGAGSDWSLRPAGSPLAARAEQQGSLCVVGRPVVALEQGGSTHTYRLAPVRVCAA